MDFAIYGILIAFAINLILSPIFIPFLRRLKFGQYVRDDGPQSHLKKAGTPTMGGIIILTSMILTSILFIPNNPHGQAVLFVTVGFGIIGFLDDFLKITKKRSMGLRAYQKIIGQLFISAMFAYYLFKTPELGDAMVIPFTKGDTFSLGFLFIPFVIFVMIGTVNSVNLTDGLDGLASGVTVLVATFFGISAWGIANGFWSSVGAEIGQGLLPIAAAAIGSLLGFLLFNSYPARVFMGDTGSLALGGFVAASAFLLRMPLFLLIVGLVYVIECVSVILQVGYFKLTKKRIFKMAPIHHHFELCGWTETKVVAVFYIVTAILCLVGFLAVN